MATTDILYLVVALLLGFGLGVLSILLVRRRSKEVIAYEVVEEDVPPPRAAAAHPPPPPPPPAPSRPERSPWAPPERPPEEPAFDDTFSVASERPPPTARDELARPPVPEMSAPSTVPTEWARRHVGPVEAGRVKGVCSGCGTAITISKVRPVRIACPVCGRTRLLS